MSSLIGSHIPMAGPVRDVYDLLAELVTPTCGHPDKHHKSTADPTEIDDECGLVDVEGLEQAANTIVGRLNDQRVTTLVSRWQADVGNMVMGDGSGLPNYSRGYRDALAGCVRALMHALGEI